LIQSAGLNGRGANKLNYWILPGTIITDHPMQLINYICDITGISYADITSKKRDGHIIDIRHLIIYFLHNRFKDKYCLTDIANFVNLKSHSSALHSIRVTNNLKQTDRDFRALFESIEKRLKEN